MRKNIFVIVIVFSSVMVNGQENKFSFGLTGSIDFYNYFFNHNYSDHFNYFDHFKTLPGYSTGLDIDYRFNEKLFLYSGLLFSMREIKCFDDGNPWFMKDDEPMASPPSTTDLKAYYLNVPVMLGYRLFNTPKLGFYSSFGIAGGVLIGNRENTDFYFTGEKPTNYLNRDLNKFLFSTQFDLGIEYLLGEKLFIIFEPYFNYGINKMEVKIMSSGAISYGGIMSLNYKI